MTEKNNLREKNYKMNMLYEHVLRKAEQLRTGKEADRGAKNGLADTDIMDKAMKELRAMARKTRVTDMDDDLALIDVIFGLLLVIEDLLDDRMKSGQ